MIDSLLTVCTGNICRSPMAAALFAERARLRGRPLEVASAGVAALVGEPAEADVCALMAERGLDIASHRAQQLTGELGARYDLVLVMERDQRRYVEQRWPRLTGRVRRLGEWRGEDVYDPYGLSGHFSAQCLTQIESCVNDWEERLFA